MLDATEQSVTSLLKRARATLQQHWEPETENGPALMSNQPSSPA
jgi:hypothetical protein